MAPSRFSLSCEPATDCKIPNVLHSSGFDVGISGLEIKERLISNSLFFSFFLSFSFFLFFFLPILYLLVSSLFITRFRMSATICRGMGSNERHLLIFRADYLCLPDIVVFFSHCRFELRSVIHDALCHGTIGSTGFHYVYSFLLTDPSPIEICNFGLDVRNQNYTADLFR